MKKAEQKIFARSRIQSSGVRARKIFCKVVGVTIALLFSSWLMFHTFSYNAKAHEIQIAYKLWSDFGAHVPLIRSFSMGDNFTRVTRGNLPEYPIFPGAPIRYHFIFYMFVGLLEKTGLRIDWALNIPSILGFTLLLISIFILAQKLFQSTAVALLSVLFFLCNGSLSFIRFFTLHPLSLQSLTDIFHAKDFPAFAPWGPGDITAFWNLNVYTNQRHLAFAFSLIILFILTCLRVKHYSKSKQTPWAILWSIVMGILPFFHQPTLLILVIVMATYMVFFPKLRFFLLITGIFATLLVVPQLLAVRGSSNPLEWYPGYIIHNELSVRRFISFWWQNLGLHSILILAGFFFLPGRAKLALIPIIPLIIIPNLFKFSVEVSANHKFFNFAMILGQMISAYLLVNLFNAIRHASRHWIIGLLIIVLTLSGLIDLFVIANDTKGNIEDIPRNEIATWISSHTPTDAVFLNSSYLYHPASIAGRSILLGWPYFAWSAGYKENRMPIMKTMYEGRNAREVCSLLSKYHISYITVEEVKNDPNLPRIDLAYYLKTYTPSFTSHENRYAIFSSREICTKK